jgi:hypothetical protein
MGARLVPKKALAYCLVSTTSVGSGFTSGQNAAKGLPSITAAWGGGGGDFS